MGNTDANNVTLGILNKSGSEIIFESIHPLKFKQPIQWFAIKCPPKMAVQLPHSYYVITSKNDKEIPVEKYYGRRLDELKERHPEIIAWTPDKAFF